MMKGYFKSVDPWRGLTALALIAASALICILFGVMSMLVLHQDK